MGIRLAVLAALALAGPVAAQEYHVDPSARNVVRFVSRAAIEEFEGVTDRIDGYLVLGSGPLGPATPQGDTEVYLEVDLASLDTGIGLRNRHMRENYLEVSRYPYATFQGRIESVEAEPGGGFRVAARGGLSIHGVSRDRVLACRVEPAGAGFRARCGFEVLLTDHDIEIPRVMFLKLAEEIRLELDFTVVPARAPQGGTP